MTCKFLTVALGGVPPATTFYAQTTSSAQRSDPADDGLTVCSRDRTATDGGATADIDASITAGVASRTPIAIRSEELAQICAATKNF